MSDTTPETPAKPADAGGMAKLKKLFNKGRPDAAGLDFLPSDYAEKKAKRRADIILLSLFGVTVGAIGVTWHLCEKELAAAEASYAEVNHRYTQAARRIEQVNQMRERQKSVADRIELSASLLERMPRSNLLAEITNALPEGVVLSQVELQAKRIKQASVAAPAAKTSAAKAAPPPRPEPLKFDTTLAIEGTALTEGQVSDYIDSLGRGGYFEDIDLLWVKQEQTKAARDSGRGPTDVRRFLIALKLDPSAEARPSDALVSTITNDALGEAAGEGDL